MLFEAVSTAIMGFNLQRMADRPVRQAGAPRGPYQPLTRRAALAGPVASMGEARAVDASPVDPGAAARDDAVLAAADGPEREVPPFGRRGARGAGARMRRPRPSPYPGIRGRGTEDAGDAGPPPRRTPRIRSGRGVRAPRRRRQAPMRSSMQAFANPTPA